MVREMSLQEVLQGIVSLIVEFMECDSCLVYLLDGNGLVLCASNTPHPSTIGKIRLKLDEGLTGWVARERRLLAIPREAYRDSRFKYFGDLPEDSYEAFLSVPVIARNRVVGVINVQHRDSHHHTRREIQLISMIGFLVGAEIEMARLEVENSQLSERLETRKIVERAKGILQRDLGVTEEEAYLTIQRQSRQRRKSKKEISEAIVLGDDLRRGKQP